MIAMLGMTCTQAISSQIRSPLGVAMTWGSSKVFRLKIRGKGSNLYPCSTCNQSEKGRSGRYETRN